ncbi:MAG: OmpA family protein [Spirosomataceae bacterium]
MNNAQIFKKHTLLSTLVVTFMLFAMTAAAQMQAYKKGIASFEKGFYNVAIKELQKVKQVEETETARLNYLIAESYRLSNRWTEAIPYFEKSFAAGLDNSEAKFNYAYALKANGEYDKSLVAFTEFVNTKNSDKLLNERANREINTLRITDELKKRTSDLDFKNLKAVNTEGAEFSPMIYKGDIVFSASRKNKVYSNGLPFLGIYKAQVNKNLDLFGETELFSSEIFDAERNEGTPAFSPDGKTVIFARSNSGKRRDLSPDVDLYISRLLPAGTWTEPRVVTASDSASWDGSPSFSRNGNTIYFGSNRPGGSGGIDLYSVNMDASGRFGNPQNMGRTINTPGDEMFPFVSEDGKLYFSSDGHPGLGKLDLFVAVRSGGKTTIENMGLPYNTAADDFGMSMDDAGNIFFSSNRAGGVGDDDIYFYKAPERPELAENTNPVDPTDPKDPTLTDGNKEKEVEIKVVNYYLAGNVYNSLSDSTSTAVPQASVTIAKYADGFEETVAELTTDDSGRFGPVKLEEDTDYTLLVNKTEYLSKRETFTMFGRTIPPILLAKPVTDTTFYTDITLEQVFIGKAFRLENIYYDLDKFDIRPDAAVELDKLVQILNDNPNIKIELGSHTDARSTDIYNLRLSQKRADAAIDYVVSRGITRERLTAKGYGESELIIERARSEEEHQVNRRTEFKVLEIGA